MTAEALDVEFINPLTMVKLYIVFEFIVVNTGETLIDCEDATVKNAEMTRNKRME